jgi:hypothetical protein
MNHQIPILVGTVCLIVVGPSAASADGPEIPPGAKDLAEYRFESDQIDGSNLSNVLDPTGWLDGQIFGEPTTVPGFVGDAMLFDGFDDYVVIPETANMSYRMGLVVEAKVKMSDSLANGGGIVTKWYGGDQWLLAAHPNAGAFGYVGFAVRLDDGTPDGVYHNVEYWFPDADYLGSWITLTAVFDPQVGLQLFQDNVLVASNPVTGMPIADGYSTIQIGDAGNDWSRFEGAIDEVKVWGDFTPAPRDVVRLIEYDFDELEVDDKDVANEAVENANWLTGELTGGVENENSGLFEQDLVLGSSQIPGDLALRLNVPWDDLATPLDSVEVIHGDHLEFGRGILVHAKIYFEAPLSKSVSQIATQLTGGTAGLSHWRLAVDWIEGEDYNLTFIVHFEDGTDTLVKYPLPPDYVGQWKDVAGAYDPTTGLAALFWEYRRVATTDIGQKAIRWGPDPIRIGRGEASTMWAAFEGRIDDVRIWGNNPGCDQLTTEADPVVGGWIVVKPQAGDVPDYCNKGPLHFANGEEVTLDARPSEHYVFYEWLGPLRYLEHSEPHKHEIGISIVAPVTATARFLEASQAPVMDTFPVAGPHNTGHDPTCSPDPCDYGGGAENSNDDCHGGGVDIFADLATSVVASQRGQVRFRCDEIGGIVAEIFNPSRTDWQFAYYYAHLDGVCLKNPEGDPVHNPCQGFDFCADECEGCGEDDECYPCCVACKSWVPEMAEQDKVCPEYFENRQLVNGDWVYDVEAGQMLGWVGKSGNAACTSHHLHFGIYDNEWGWDCDNLNPFPYLYTLENALFSEWIFVDGFETGNVSGWSNSFP